jgi:hypothetical protein
MVFELFIIFEVPTFPMRSSAEHPQASENAVPVRIPNPNHHLDRATRPMAFSCVCMGFSCVLGSSGHRLPPGLNGHP